MRNLITGLVTFSVDVPRPEQVGVSPTMLSGAVDGLLDLASEFRIPLTWAVSDPGRWPVAARVRRDPAGHELALLADHATLGDRSRFAAFLAQGTTEAARFGYRVGTLALLGSAYARDLDLLVRNRISVVRAAIGVKGSRSSRAEIRPLSSRYGVWRIPLHVAVGCHRGWWTSGEAAEAVAVVRRAVETGGVANIAFDVVRAIREDVDILAIARRVLKTVRQLEKKHQVSLGTLGDVGATASLALASPPMRSVLRRVA